MPSSRSIRSRSPPVICASRLSRRFRVGDFFSRMWLEKAWRALSLPVPVFLKRFFAPECDFIFGMSGAEFLSRIKHDAERYGRVVKAANVKAE